MELMYEDEKVKLYLGDAIEIIDSIPDNIIQTTITSPTYWGKRCFTGDEREFGSEPLEEYVEKNVILYSKILEKTKKEGSLFVVIQDSYMGSGISRSHHNYWEHNKNPEFIRNGLNSRIHGNVSSVTARHDVIKKKSLCGIPFRIAIKLVDMGFIWRELIIWEKPNPMPSSVKDRVRQSTEYILHFVKNRIYKLNQKYFQVTGQNEKPRMDNQVWVASTEPKSGHSATFPSKIVSRLLLATTDEGDTVFEPFLGSGTMYDLSMKHNRKFIGCDIYKKFIKDTTKKIKGGLDFFIYEGNIKDKIDNTNNKKIVIEKEKIRKMLLDFNHALLKSIEFIASTSSINNYKITHNFKTRVNNTQYSFYGLIETNSRKFGLVIPSISSFDQSGGAAAFYSAKRLFDAISKNVITNAIILVPKNTSGQKFQSIIENANGKIFVQEFTQKIADLTVKYQKEEKVPPKEVYDISRYIFHDLIEYDHLN
ncbi:MAG: DNA-methyltransferase [Candidatus Thorarchaeota archaeon]